MVFMNKELYSAKRDQHILYDSNGQMWQTFDDIHY